MNDIFANTETMQENEHPRFYTAESVMRGHPDKLCDLIADSVLDACLQHDPASRVACEVMYNKLQANRARIFRPMVDSLLLLKSQQEHQNAARESIYADAAGSYIPAYWIVTAITLVSLALVAAAFIRYNKKVS